MDALFPLSIYSLIALGFGDIIAGYYIYRHNNISIAKIALAVVAGNAIMIPLVLLSREALLSSFVRRWLFALFLVAYIANLTGISLVLHFLAPDKARPFFCDTIQMSLPYAAVVTICSALPILCTFVLMWR
ncbi:MAG: hypothetical protein ACYS8W_17540 [Planctomycetota bacterium]|jgi:hypothetical protein